MSQWSGPKGQGPSNSTSSGGKSSNKNSNNADKKNTNGNKGDKNQQGPGVVMLTDLPRQILMQIQSFSPQMIETLETQMLGTTSKKKRRDHFKDMLKLAGVGGGNDTLAGAVGKRTDASVLDIRRKMGLQRTTSNSTAAKNNSNSSFFDRGHGSSDSDLNLSSFFGG